MKLQLSVIACGSVVAHSTRQLKLRLLEMAVVLLTIAMPAFVRGGILWDACDSHYWSGETWGSDIVADYGSFAGRTALRCSVTNSDSAWALVRTQGFPLENWNHPTTSVWIDVYISGASGAKLKLEIRGTNFDPIVASVISSTLLPNQWQTVKWALPGGTDLSQVGFLSLVIDNISGLKPTAYIDNLRLVGESVRTWDTMDIGRDWEYHDNFYNWSGVAPTSFPGLEPTTTHEGAPTSPTASVFLQWDFSNGVNPSLSNATVETRSLDDRKDWRGITRVSADIMTSDTNIPISILFFDDNGLTNPIDRRGFGVPTRMPQVANTWHRRTWDVPWPDWFIPTNIDAISFIANDIDKHQQGTLYIDNITLYSNEALAVSTGLVYMFENFNDNPVQFTDFSGNWGEIIGESITTHFYEAHSVDTGASLRVDYAFGTNDYTGIFFSLWGHSDWKSNSVDFTDFFGALQEPNRDIDQIQFWTRGSGLTTNSHNVKIELKDGRDQFSFTALRYFSVEDHNTNWSRIVLDANVTNESFWSYNQWPPDPTRMKFLVFVLEKSFNNSTGTLYIDSIQLVDADDAPLDLSTATDDQFLDLVERRTFMYFLDWYDWHTGQVRDRSSFPDLFTVAGTGFGLSALVVGTERGWIDRTLAISMVSNTLRKTSDGQFSETNGHRGFFYHFLDSDGARKGDSELSSVDTALLLAGILTVREYFHDVPEIVTLASQIYARVEWDWMYDPGTGRIFHAWKPEYTNTYQIPAPGGGFFSTFTSGAPLQWDYSTDETMLLNLFAIGSHTHPVPPESFYSWVRVLGAYTNSEPSLQFIQSASGSLFTYFFAHLWIDFARLGRDGHPTTPVNWWSNSVIATLANYRYAVDHSDDASCDGDNSFLTYSSNSWGITASDGPYETDAYRGYGVVSALDSTNDGTVAIYGAGSSIMFDPIDSIRALRNYFGGTDGWRYRFGFGDAYNLDPPACPSLPWYNHVVFAIDQGPMLLAIENHRSCLLWHVFGSNRAVRAAIYRVFPRADYDQDGMADPWEIDNHLDPNDPSDAAQDADGDGLSNWAEYVADTHPADSNSFMTVTSLTVSNQLIRRISVPCSTNRDYAIAYTTNLVVDMWTTLGTNVACAGNMITVEDAAQDASCRFYRLVAKLKP